MSRSFTCTLNLSRLLNFSFFKSQTLNISFSLNLLYYFIEKNESCQTWTTWFPVTHYPFFPMHFLQCIHTQTYPYFFLLSFEEKKNPSSYPNIFFHLTLISLHLSLLGCCIFYCPFLSLFRFPLSIGHSSQLLNNSDLSHLFNKHNKVSLI